MLRRDTQPCAETGPAAEDPAAHTGQTVGHTDAAVGHTEAGAKTAEWPWQNPDPEPAGEARSITLKVRVTPAEKAALEGLAAATDVSLSTVVRGAALAVAGGSHLLTPQDRQHLEDLLRQVRGIATNLNQLALAQNLERAGRRMPRRLSPAEVEQLLQQAQVTITVIRDAVGRI